MPEGPECEITARSLNQRLKGKYLVKLKFDKPVKSKNLENIKFPLKIKRVEARAKKICFILGKSKMLVSSPLMTGMWSYKKWDYHRMTMIVADDVLGRFVVNAQEVYYSDRRIMGNIVYLQNQDMIDTYFKKFGPDILHTEVSAKEWVKIFSKPTVQKKQIAVALLEPNIIGGVGNYQKADIPYLAKVSPHTLVKDISAKRLEKIRVLAHKIIRKALAGGGLTIGDYYSPEGYPGNYKPAIYGLKEDKLGNKVKNDKDSKGRGNHWVPEVQIY